jgi:hypothetical protein
MECLKQQQLKLFPGKIELNLIDQVKLVQELILKFTIQMKKVKEKFALKEEICLLGILRMNRPLEKQLIMKDMFILVILDT